MNIGLGDMNVGTPELRRSPSYSSLGSPSFVSPADTFTTELDDSDFEEFRASYLQLKHFQQYDTNIASAAGELARKAGPAFTAVNGNSPRQPCQPPVFSSPAVEAEPNESVFEQIQQLDPGALDQQQVASSTTAVALHSVPQSDATATFCRGIAGFHSVRPIVVASSEIWEPLQAARDNIVPDAPAPYDTLSGDLKRRNKLRGTKRKKRSMDHADLVQRDGPGPAVSRIQDNADKGLEIRERPRGVALRDDDEVLASRRNDILPAYHQEGPGRQVFGGATNSPYASHESHGVRIREARPPTHPPVSVRRRRGKDATILQVQETLPYRLHPSATAEELVTSQTLLAAASSSHTDLTDSKYQCEHCGRDFAKKSNVDEHKKQIHSEERPYVCSEPDCGATFKMPSILTRHIRTHNPDDQVYCLGCDHAGFSQPNALRIHLTDRKRSEQCIRLWLELGEDLGRLSKMLKRNISTRSGSNTGSDRRTDTLATLL